MSERNIYILFDCPDDHNDKAWLLDELKEIHSGGVFSVSIHKVLSRLSRKGLRGKMQERWIMLAQCMRALKHSQKDDVIICWNHMTGLIMNALSMSWGSKRSLILMNWLTPVSAKRKTRSLQKLASMNPKVKIIVNSPESPEKWKVSLGMTETEKFHVIPDVYDTSVPFLDIKEKGRKYCFTGGMNNRDWALIKSMADRHPEIKFVCVALENDFKRKVTDIPDNMEVYFNLLEDQYYGFMENAYLVLLPLLDKRVAGLINILRAAQHGVPCLITSTPATRQYYGKQSEDMLLSDDRDEWEQVILRWYALDYQKYKDRVERFQKHIHDNFLPRRAAEKIMEIIRVDPKKEVTP